jgi:hypothetical protein
MERTELMLKLKFRHGNNVKDQKKFTKIGQQLRKPPVICHSHCRTPKRNIKEENATPHCSFRALDLEGFAGLIMLPRRINTMGAMVPM